MQTLQRPSNTGGGTRDEDLVHAFKDITYTETLCGLRPRQGIPVPTTEFERAPCIVCIELERAERMRR